MEAAGIEPASENIQLKATTCLSFSQYLALRLLKRQDAAQPGLNAFRSPDSGRIRIAILFIGASQASQEYARETACLNIRQLVAVVLHLVVFHLFNEVDGASTCDLSLTVSVETSSPPYLHTKLYFSGRFLSTGRTGPPAIPFPVNGGHERQPLRAGFCMGWVAAGLVLQHAQASGALPLSKS